MAKIALYSPKDVTVLLGGFYKVDGFSADTFINIRKDVKPFDSMKSMDGEQARVYRKDEGFTVELSLAQSSTTNDILSALYNVDVATHMGKFPLFIKDGKGTTVFFAGTAWIEDIPDVSFSNDMSIRTWVFGTSEAGLTVGSNSENNTALGILGIGASLLPLLSGGGLF
jgi:hypothetical protein